MEKYITKASRNHIDNNVYPTKVNMIDSTKI